MTIEEERMQILDWIDSGKIGVEDGLALLQALTSSEEEQGVTSEQIVSSSEVYSPKVGLDSQEMPEPLAEAQEDISPIETDSSEKPHSTFLPHAERWRRWWMIPLWIGVGITITGGLLMFQAMRAYGLGFWFVCASMPLALGLVIMVLSWQSRTAPWLHLRIDQKPGERPRHIAISLPIPIKPTVWFLRTFGKRIPELKDKSVDEIILALGERTSPENPLYIEVSEGDEGERVEVYIG